MRPEQAGCFQATQALYTLLNNLKNRNTKGEKENENSL